MSAACPPAEVLQRHQGQQGFGYLEPEKLTKPFKEEQVGEESIESYFKPEIQGLRISGIIAIVAAIVSFVCGYALLSTLFIVPLLGVGLAYIYIKRTKKAGH